MQLTKDEQVVALMEGRIHKLELKDDLGQPIPWQAVRDEFTITQEDVFAYVDEHGFPRDCTLLRAPHSLDGYYLVKEGERWNTYYQERGIPMAEQHFHNPDEAIKRVIEMMLSGSGIPNRTKT